MRMISKYKESLFKLKHFPISGSKTLSLEYTDIYRGEGNQCVGSGTFHLNPDPDPSNNMIN